MRGRSRPHLSLREGSEQPPGAALKTPLLQSLLQPPPFPLALDDPGSVLAVKGSLRRFAPWTAPGRSEGMTVYEGKGGVQISASDFVSHLIAFDSITPRPKPGHSGRACRAEREPFGHTSRLEPQPWGAVTRRAVAQRRSRASGLTRLSA